MADPNLFGPQTGSNFFGLTFKGTGLPAVQGNDPELQRIIMARNAAGAQDDPLPEYNDPYAGKGFGGQLVQQLKDELTGGAEHRQAAFENQLRQAQLRNDKRRLDYTARGLDQAQEGLGYEAKRTAIAGNVDARAQTAADAKKAAIDALTVPELRILAELHPEELTFDRVATPETLNRTYINIANAKRQAANVEAFGPGGVRGPGGTTLEQDFARQQSQSRPVITGLAPRPETGGGPLDASFAPTAPARRTMGAVSPIAPAGGTAPVGGLSPMAASSAVPQVIPQRQNPWNPKDTRLMAGNVVPNPDAGSLFRQSALDTLQDGPVGIKTAGNMQEESQRWHPDTQGELTRNQQLLGYSRLQADWDHASGNYREMKRQEGLMNDGMNAARRGDLAQGSQAVLVTFQKILDPTSVVRESEYARSASGLSAVSQIEGFVEKLRSGGAGVPLDELENFAKLARTFLQNADSGLQGHRARLENTAKEFNLNPDLIFDSDAGKPKFTRTTPAGKVIPFNSQDEVDIYDAAVAAATAKAAAGRGGGAPPPRR